MWAVAAACRRGAARASPAALRHAGSSGAAPGAAPAAGWSCFIGRGGSSGSAAAVRAFSNSFWEVPQAARHELYLELHTARGMLPHRSNFSPQFTPHGVQLLPHDLQPGLATLRSADDAWADAAAQAADEAGVFADSVKRKRRLKMKKHKYKKRMKKLRHSL